jgi:hypothetical protein
VVKEDIRSWKDLPCSWIGRNITVKMVILPKAIYLLNAITFNIPMASITETENIPKRAMLEVSQCPSSSYTTEP